jgi:hypothetical protein
MIHYSLDFRMIKMINTRFTTRQLQGSWDRLEIHLRQLLGTVGVIENTSYREIEVTDSHKYFLLFLASY